MPHHLIVGNAIHSSAASLRDAQTGLSTLRAQGLKPRLFFSLSFDSFGSELDDDGRPLHHYTLMSTDEFEAYLTHFERVRLLTDPEHTAPPLRVVDVQGVLEGRDYHIAELLYPGFAEEPEIRVQTLLMRATQGLVDLQDLLHI